MTLRLLKIHTCPCSGHKGTRQECFKGQLTAELSLCIEQFTLNRLTDIKTTCFYVHIA